MQPWTTRPLDHPQRYLFASFVGWKLLLLFIAAGTPSPGYDTSTSLILSPDHSGENGLALASDFLIQKLTRWDAIYFVKAAQRGYVFEQEWAFGWGFTRLIALCTAVLRNASLYEGLEALLAIVIAHLAHLLSVLVLFKLTLAIFPGSPPKFALITALFHIISPAGLFLSAPYAESSCALLSFTGCLLFSKSFSRTGEKSAKQDLFVLLSGILFGIATTFRSNGILYGLLLLEEALRTSLELKHRIQIGTLRRLIATGFGGLSVACGFLLPQYIAYTQYCVNSEGVMRIWCKRRIPSIYTFVQEHYWNVGLFRYWTLSNLPLFLLATPMYALMIKSCLWAFAQNKTDHTSNPKPASNATGKKTRDFETQILQSIAAAQLALVLLTLSTAHVQIITRISSAFPVWMWYAAAISTSKGDSVLAGSILKFSVMYAAIQGGLFASFLPPA